MAAYTSDKASRGWQLPNVEVVELRNGLDKITGLRCNRLIMGSRWASTKKMMVGIALVIVLVAAGLVARATSEHPSSVEVHLYILPYAEVVVGTTQLDLGSISVVGANYQADTPVRLRANIPTRLSLTSLGWTGDLSPLNEGIGWSLYRGASDRPELSVAGTQTDSRDYNFEGEIPFRLEVSFSSDFGERWNWWDVEMGSYVDTLAITVSARAQ